MEIHTKGINGSLIAEIQIPISTSWQDIKVPVKKFEEGIQDLYVLSKENNKKVEVDWIRFE